MMNGKLRFCKCCFTGQELAKEVEKGLIASMELIYYLLADGYKIKTPLLNMKICIPGEYNGSEDALPPSGLEPDEPAEPVKASVIMINAPRTLKVVVPQGLKEGAAYQISVITQASPKHTSTLLKELRHIQSSFTLTAK